MLWSKTEVQENSVEKKSHLKSGKPSMSDLKNW